MRYPIKAAFNVGPLVEETTVAGETFERDMGHRHRPNVQKFGALRTENALAFGGNIEVGDLRLYVNVSADGEVYVELAGPFGSQRLQGRQREEVNRVDENTRQLYGG